MTEVAVTVYGLPRCGTCVKAQAWLKKHAIAFTFVDYREQRIAPDVLRAWSAQLGWNAMINRSSTSWRELPATRRNPGSDPEWTLLLREHPTLLKRPVLVRDGQVTLGFSDGLYRKVFGI
jgi:Spx/MgsR family transcriptional regulator